MGWVFDPTWSAFDMANIWQTDASIYTRKLVLNIDQLEEIIPIDTQAYRQPSIVGGGWWACAPHQPLRKCQVRPKPFIF